MTSPVVHTTFDGGAPEPVWRDVAELFVESFTAAPYFEDAAELGTIAQWGPEHLRQGAGRLVAARRDERLVGFALAHGLVGDAAWQGILSQLTDSTDASSALDRPENALVVHELAVRESERGRGIAGSCLAALLQDRPEPRTFIGVYERATAAAAMYRHWQLTEIGQVPMPGDAVALHVLTAPTARLASHLARSASVLRREPA
ncbi:MAG TPA: GNAT family N-acetyltransferase [Plantibacter sp.]|uniref:GNAT family N-acetyltransferase n=1 Tax=unclassified Plantibacter TaxID=2624265 RepID=UPI002BAB63C0|nr:GNAT family N-acetyltransferase [Plantibacter sp.]